MKCRYLIVQRKLLVVICLLNLIPKVILFEDINKSSLSRQKRFLVWKPGADWVQLVMGIGLPAEVSDQSITLGAAMKATYFLPMNSSYYINPSIDIVRRRKRDASRWNLYKGLIYFLERSGVGDGKACLLRAICEVAEIPFEQRTGLFAEVVHVLLTPSSTAEEIQEHSDLEYHAAEKLGREIGNCASLYSDCSNSLINRFTKTFCHMGIESMNEC